MHQPQWSFRIESAVKHYGSRLSMMVCINWNEDTSSGLPWRFFNTVVFVLDNFAADSAITPINATGHQLVTNWSPIGHPLPFNLCWGAGTDSWPHSDKLVSLVFIFICYLPFLVLFFHTHGVSFRSQNTSFHAHLLFTGLDDVLSRLELVEQSSSRAVLRLGDNSDTSGDDTRTCRMKKAWGTTDVGQFFMTGPTDVATKPSHFYCRICLKVASVLTQCHHEILRHFQGQGSKHFQRDQRLRLETPCWKCWTVRGMPWVLQK